MDSPSIEALKSEGDVNLSPHRAEWQEQHLDDETQRWLEEDSRYFIRQSLSTPCLDVLAGCEGIYLEDLQGRRFMDFHGNNVHHAGFANQRVIEAIERQMRTLSFCPRRFTNIPAIRLARKLAEIAPGDLNKVLFAPGGTTAIGMALKLARAATGRQKTISLWDSFHGASLDAISIGGEAIFRAGAGPLLPGTEHVPPPDPYRCVFGCGGDCSLRCADYIEYILEKERDVAAVIAETVRSNSIVPAAGYWQKVRAACDRYGTLLILDGVPHALCNRRPRIVEQLFVKFTAIPTYAMNRPRGRKLATDETFPPEKVFDIEAEEKASRDFRITGEHQIGQGGLQEKARDNIAAIRLLKTLEAENRDATEDEKAVLARYVGWGAMPNVFGRSRRSQSCWN